MPPPNGTTVADRDSTTALSGRPGYELRSIRFLELWACRGWTLKVYGIGLERPRSGSSVVSPSFVNAAKEVLDRALLTAAPDPGASPPAGFAILHEGRLARWLILDLWHDWVLLHHVLHRADHHAPAQFLPVRNGLCACTWELRVIGYERDAWLTHVLASADAPDLGSYLRSRLAEDC